MRRSRCRPRGPREAERLLDLKPPRRQRARKARKAGPPALEGRARLQTAQGRTRPRPLRGPLLPRLVPPHRARHRRPRVPDPGAAEPKSPAAGLSLPQAVLLLQPIFKCWTGRCTTCKQTINLNKELHRKGYAACSIQAPPARIIRRSACSARAFSSRGPIRYVHQILTEIRPHPQAASSSSRGGSAIEPEAWASVNRGPRKRVEAATSTA